MASLAVLVSTFNIAGGFVISKRMLDMFKKKDTVEYNYLYSGSGAAMAGALLAAHFAGIPHIYTTGYLASALCCIGAICGLS
mmetsp:Transcript_85536/g.128172  ORF Transcript_85536/g.128172 Transcript_85536/m.128172 type:complete len:82 (-) Transcript_85536:1344-1589(-)